MFVASTPDAAEKTVALAVLMWVASGMAVMTRLRLPPPRPVTILPTLKLADESTATSSTPACAPLTSVCVLHQVGLAKSLMKYSSWVPKRRYGP